jgi:hypothetical protein
MAMNEFQRWIMRQRALGKKIPLSLAQSYLSADLSAKAREARVGDVQAKDIAARKELSEADIALRRDIAERQAGISEKQLGLSERELGLSERQLGLLEDRYAAEGRAARMGGILDIAKTGLQYELLAKETGLPSMIEGVKGVTSGLLPESTVSLTPMAETGGYALEGVPALETAFAEPAAATVGGEAVTGAELGAEVGAGVTTTPSTLTSVGYGAGAGVIAGYIGQALTKAGRPGHEGGERLTGGAVGGLGGALAGFYVGGPLGAVVGGIFGAFSGSGGTVICTELHRQGYMTDEMLELDSDFASTVDIETYIGYRKLAEPVVKMMQKSKTITHIVKPLALSWAKEMAHTMKPNKCKWNLIGKAIMKIGTPICRLKGKAYIKEVRQWAC